MNINKEYIAFKGQKFTIEWYFSDKGKSIAYDYFENLDDENQIKLLGLFELIGNMGEIKNKTKFKNSNYSW